MEVCHSPHIQSRLQSHSLPDALCEIASAALSRDLFVPPAAWAGGVGQASLQAGSVLPTPATYWDNCQLLPPISGVNNQTDIQGSGLELYIYAE